MVDGIVSTRYGMLRGDETEGVFIFRGIRYGQAPTGELRLRPPQPPTAWSGLREAREFGPIAPQPKSGLGSYVPGDPLNQDEDCLFLNVFSVNLTGPPRPVMVFVHGGAFMTGSGSQAMYAGDDLAKRGVVVVTFNYRLGVLGFLAHPALHIDGRGCGNWALHDVVAVLHWVRDNIAGFGGDPTNVTVFGESAGAMAICDLLGAPVAEGLFQRAIVQSGATSALDLDLTVRTAERFRKTLGVSDLQRATLRAVPVADLLSAQAVISDATDGGYGLPFRPVIDGGLLAEHPAVAIASGRSREIDLLSGTNRDEFRFFSVAAGIQNLDRTTLEQIISRYLQTVQLEPFLDARVVIERYESARASRGDSIDERDLLDAIAGDWIFRVPVLRLASASSARGARNFAYLFDWESPFAGGALGACHGLELPFVFGTWRLPIIGLFSGTGPGAEALANAMQSAWVAFATTGDPGNPVTGDWPPYEGQSRMTMRFGDKTHLQGAPYEEERAFWEGPLGRYGVDGPIEHGAPRAVALMAPEDEAQSGT